MKKDITTTLLATVVGLGFAACNPKEETKNKAASESHPESAEKKAAAGPKQTQPDTPKPADKKQADTITADAEAKAKAAKKAAEEAAANLKKSATQAGEPAENRPKEAPEQK